MGRHKTVVRGEMVVRDKMVGRQEVDGERQDSRERGGGGQLTGYLLCGVEDLLVDGLVVAVGDFPELHIIT